MSWRYNQTETLKSPDSSVAPYAEISIRFEAKVIDPTDADLVEAAILRALSNLQLTLDAIATKQENKRNGSG